MMIVGTTGIRSSKNGQSKEELFPCVKISCGKSLYNLDYTFFGVYI